LSDIGTREAGEPRTATPGVLGAGITEIVGPIEAEASLWTACWNLEAVVRNGTAWEVDHTSQRSDAL
jgi:hypothetical protein